MWQAKQHAGSGAYAVGVLAVALSAGAIYLLDPRSGTRRRTLLRDRLNRARRRIRESARESRAYAQLPWPASRIRSSNDSLHDRAVRAHVRIGRDHRNSQPELIKYGNAIILGRCSRHLDSRGQLAGRMRASSRSGDVSARQIPEHLSPPKLDLLRRPRWSSVSRLIVGSGGAAIAVAGFGRRSLSGLGLASGGLALLLRSICNKPFSYLFGLHTYTDDGFLVWRTIHVHAHACESYRCWRELERFPQFMKHVRSVRQVDDTLYHWTVKGPGGMSVEWNARITADIPCELIAWHTMEGAPVESYGIVLFEPDGHAEGTRIHLRMAYRPPGNAAGRLAANMLGRNPNRQIDDDLTRFKTFLESAWLREAERNRD